ncbi:exodeoxyribonuclease III [Chondrocystis sp. NIES-4102]|nr:exodeoxyribonuclease III [Chondrocystis sp. NIES-4102]
MSIVIDWLQQHRVDILCLQETKVQDQQFPRSLFEDLGYHIYLSGQKSYNGVAIFSLKPLSQVSCSFSSIVGDLAAFDAQKRVITGVVDDIRIVNVYVPNGSALDSDKYQYKLSWLQVLETYLQTLQKEGREICVCGDFNIALEDKDIYTNKARDKHIMSSPPEREALRRILDLGFQDAFRKFTTDTGYYSWWDYRAAGFNRNRGWRIDHLYLTSQLYNSVSKCWIDIEPRKQEKPSDHTPVIIEF